MTKASGPRSGVLSITLDVLRDWQEEAVALVKVLRLEWRLLLLLLLALTAAVVWYDSLPKRTLRMAKGQPGSGLEVMATRYRDELARHGLTLELVPSGGAIDNLRMVSEGRADIGLSQSGLPAPKGVYYLGSVAYQPLWLFHRDQSHQHRQLPEFLSGKVVSVGVPGSGSHGLSERLLHELSAAERERVRPLHLNNQDTVAALREGQIDAAFLVAAMGSVHAQLLMWTPGVAFYDFAQAQGLALRWGFAEAVTLPAGALTLSPPNPAQDVRMIAVTMTLVAHQSLHPATQQLLMGISKKIASQTQDVLDRPGQFPRFVDLGLPRSPEAERFLGHGPPVLSGRLPYWLAYFVDSLWVGTLTLLALVYPFLRWKPNYRQVLFTLQTQQLRRQLDILSAQIDEGGAAVDTQALASAEQAIRDLRVPFGCHDKHQHLLAVVEKLKARAHPASGPRRRQRPLRALVSHLPKRPVDGKPRPGGPRA